MFRFDLRLTKGPLLIGLGVGLLCTELVYFAYKRSKKTPELQEIKIHFKRDGPATPVNRQLMIPKQKKAPHWYRHLDRTQDFWNLPHDKLWNTALFFPEVFPEREGSQTRQLMWYMQQAKKTLKIAIYTANFKLLEETLHSLARKKVRVMGVVNAPRCIRTWRKHGIQVREKPKVLKSPHGCGLFLDHMHNKFIIIDDRAVMTGSLNWTLSAVTENRENVLITDHAETVKLYVQEFTKLWKISDPMLKRQMTTKT